MTNQDFIYNAFFRKNPPSILRLACIQLMREGIDFTNQDTWNETWNLIWDRAEYIVKHLSKTKESRDLHIRLLNERTLDRL
jgi:hypothetical protein